MIWSFLSPLKKNTFPRFSDVYYLVYLRYTIKAGFLPGRFNSSLRCLISYLRCKWKNTASEFTCSVFFPLLITSFKRKIYWFLQFSVFWQQPFKRKNHAVIINFAWDQLWPQLSFEMQLHEKQTALISSSLGLLSNKGLFQIISSSWLRVLSLGHCSC